MMKIGIPRAFSFFRFHPAMAAFFQYLGVEVVVSSPSTRATLEAGLPYALPESCLPLKLFCGHVRSLVGQVDALLVPSIQRLVPGTTNCAKLIGLPDLLRATMPDLPQLITPDVDLKGGEYDLWMMVLKEAAHFTYNPIALREAMHSAQAAFTETRTAMQDGRLTPAGFDDPGKDLKLTGGDLTVFLVGHPYNLYDPYLNHNLLNRLSRLGVSLLTPEFLGPSISADYWTFEYEVLGAARQALQRKETLGGVDGGIAVVAFGCGADGMMLEEVQQMTSRAGIPLMALNLDEHSGEAGLVTRIEAFVDMLNWRRKANGKNLPGH